MHRTVIVWVIYDGRHCRRAKIFYLPQLGIEPRSLDSQANTLTRRCKSRLLPQGSRSVLYILDPVTHITSKQNAICDKLSRFQVAEAKAEAKHLQENPVSVPTHLLPDSLLL